MILFLRICTTLSWFFILSAAFGSLYQLLGAFAVRRFATQPLPKPRERPPVTVLKPLCGDESGLYQNLLSFCELDYPCVQIVCGVRKADDPAIAVVHKLQADKPNVDITLVSNPTLHGTNYKVSNLINMMSAAKHEILVMSDSDMRWNQTISTPLSGPCKVPAPVWRLVFTSGCLLQAYGRPSVLPGSISGFCLRQRYPSYSAEKTDATGNNCPSKGDA